MAMDQIYAKEIASFLNTSLIGEDILINNVCSISKIKKHSLSFISKVNYIEDLNSEALIFINKNYHINKNSKNSYIVVADPRLAFAKIIEKFFYKHQTGISENATISQDVIIGSNCYIGNNVTIEEGVIIGSNTSIGHNSTILKNVVIGNTCNIGANCVIGNDGLGTARDGDELVMIRHLGSVIIEDNVEIGASSTVGRGTLDDTIIKEGTKLGPQVNIGHNTIIDKNCQIAGRSHISGSVKIGYSSKLWANCTIKDGISIGDNCTVGIGAVVTNDIESNITVMGLEALKLKSLVKFKKDSQYK